MAKATIVYDSNKNETAVFIQNELNEPVTNLYVSVEDAIDPYYFRRACEITSGKTIHPDRAKVLCKKMYRAEHSPIRCKMFWVEVHNCPTFVATHLVRHNIGITHFQQSHRSDLTKVPDKESNRLTPTSFGFLCNAQSLINIARKRLCFKASPQTRLVVSMIKEALEKWVDPDLAECMIPECEYRHGCNELKRCSYYEHKVKKGTGLDKIERELNKAASEAWERYKSVDKGNNDYDGGQSDAYEYVLSLIHEIKE